VVWICDPMDTQTTSQVQRGTPGYLPGSGTGVHSRGDGPPVGRVHIELTGENVNGVRGGARTEPGAGHQSEVDPRPNHEQSMELAFLIAADQRRDRQKLD
jgi:3-deoxy-7-phosphoheptulonate synthase